MATLPQLIEEDIQTMNAALGDLLAKSEASVALVIDKGGFLITQAGTLEQFDTTTLAALAAASFAATQGIAGLVGEEAFGSIYQQGSKCSMLVNNVDEYSLMVIIFDVQVSVGAVKYYLNSTIQKIGLQMKAAYERSPDAGLDLSVLNLVDTSGVFKRRE
jgi:predicted regulator of Ras-like GTPase activity (Roadblock/LC7/MglB family)